MNQEILTMICNFQINNLKKNLNKILPKIIINNKIFNKVYQKSCKRINK